MSAVRLCPYTRKLDIQLLIENNTQYLGTLAEGLNSSIGTFNGGQVEESAKSRRYVYDFLFLLSIYIYIYLI